MIWLRLRTVNQTAKQRLIDIMLRQARAAVAEDIAQAILRPWPDPGRPGDPLHQARAEQARADADLARWIGQARR